LFIVLKTMQKYVQKRCHINYVVYAVKNVVKYRYYGENIKYDGEKMDNDTPKT